MNEVQNILAVNKDVFSCLKQYIQEKASKQTKVSQFVIKNENSLIVFKEARNELYSKSTTYNNIQRALNYRIDIFCKKYQNADELLDELIVLVFEVMEGLYHMEGSIVAKDNYYDDKEEISYTASLRFNTKFIPSINKIY